MFTDVDKEDYEDAVDDGEDDDDVALQLMLAGQSQVPFS